jgi:hypothetical protein
MVRMMPFMWNLLAGDLLPADFARRAVKIK